MQIFKFNDYRHFIRFQLESENESSHGKLTEIANALEVKRSYLSQIMSGTKNLSYEQAFRLGLFFKLASLETKYLYQLVSLSRATSTEYKKSILLEMKKIKAEALEKAGAPAESEQLDERSQSIFYSSWQYSAAHLASGINQSQTAEQIAKKLGLEISATKQILAFLLEAGLCESDGIKYSSGKQKTHLPKESALNWRYQTNWRLKALDYIAKSRENDLFFTASVRIDEAAYLKIRTHLQQVIKEMEVTVQRAGDTTLACVNLDCFKL